MKNLEEDTIDGCMTDPKSEGGGKRVDAVWPNVERPGLKNS